MVKTIVRFFIYRTYPWSELDTFECKCYVATGMREESLTMAKQLNEGQKRAIDELLQSDKPILAEETIEDSIKKVLRLSDQECFELLESIENHTVEFFENLERKYT